MTDIKGSSPIMFIETVSYRYGIQEHLVNGRRGIAFLEFQYGLSQYISCLNESESNAFGDVLT